MSSQTVYPNHLQIETINGVCSARCVMCSIHEWTRKPRRMTEQEFEIILKKCVPYLPHLDFLTLHGFGEPLLDKGLSQKIALAKQLGYRGTGLATNCTELTPTMSKTLIESGLDTIICSIDGINKETHEAIRVGTNFEEVVEHVKAFIRIRDELSGNTRVLVRFIRQASNYDEWPAFFDEWNKYLSHNKGDDVIRFDEHNWGRESHIHSHSQGQTLEREEPVVCSYIFDRLYIFSNGQVSFCCADDNGFFDLGNTLEEDPLAIYNDEPFLKYRAYMLEGRIHELDHCKTCTIPLSLSKKTNPAMIKTG